MLLSRVILNALHNALHNVLHNALFPGSSRYFIPTGFLFSCLVVNQVAFSAEGVSVVTYYGYDDCIELRNALTKVTLCPAAGGRVLQYAARGKNVLYLPAGNEGWRLGQDKSRGKMHAGRFDFGPEKMVQHSNELWMGKWMAEITGDRSATTSRARSMNPMESSSLEILSWTSRQAICDAPRRFEMSAIVT